MCEGEREEGERAWEQELTGCVCVRERERRETGGRERGERQEGERAWEQELTGFHS